MQYHDRRTLQMNCPGTRVLARLQWPEEHYCQISLFLSALVLNAVFDLDV